MTDPLFARITAALTRDVDPAVASLAQELARESGACAVLFYGSNLRTGSLDGVLDFYLLLPGERERGIWPRVSYREFAREPDTLRAKIAAMTLETFRAAASGETIDTTIWARFVQPSALVWARDADSRAQVTEAVAAAARTAARLAAVLGPEAGRPADYWRALFRGTYTAELRVEKPGREDSILSANPDHFAGLLPLALDGAGVSFTMDGETIRPHISDAERRAVRRWWGKRRRLGKWLNIRRLIRATRTFEGAARYGAWKVERHTGIPVRLTPWRERHPVLAAPGVLWRVWRARRSAP
ncbi:hypothetical protein [Altericroceibacterium xinjiangense]|uniref:hypothetical protein n=1 Tax=Altericroceibacterium xinjiangense TaxID=762261 RepID=UPI000F7E288D|nr:hypothetical protein [Altericroceibacterium xinjiangense]